MSEEEAKTLYTQLWEIVQAVAEADTVYYDGSVFCIFCSGKQGNIHAPGYHHEPDCIVTRAMALVEAAKQQER